MDATPKKMGKRMSRFGRQPVADLLKERGITREAAAATVGVKLSIFNNTLAGHQTPSQEMRDGLVKLLGVELEMLFDAEPLARQLGKRYRQGARVSAGDDATIRRLTADERAERNGEVRLAG